MKKILFVAAIILCSASTFAQKQETYCDLRVYQPGFKNYIAKVIYRDSHQNNRNGEAIKDQAGNLIKFPNEIEALNYFTKQGWELVTAYHTHGGDTHFFLKKVN